MELLELENLIKAIPVRKQASIVNKKSWEKKLKGQAANKELFKEIYKGEITREDILKENNPKKKIMMTLMWGYPTGGRGNNISNILKKIEKLSTILSKDAELTEERFNQLLKKFRENEIKGLGPSTWSKLLYFFNYSIEGNKCLIYDQKIVSSLNRKQFSELANDEKKYKKNKNDYLIYLRKIKEWAEKIDAKDSDLPDKIEVFLFYFNLYYKWD